MRRLPPQQIEKNLSDLIDLVPSLCEDLLSSVDQPLKIARDKVVGKDYLLCDYNRDGDSYRSPWSNKYDPPLEDGAMPSARLRKLEVEANNAFDQYRDLYFEGGVSSVYLWDLDHGFAGVILIKKAGDGSKKIKGCWDSIHVVEVQEKSSGRTAHYKLTSTVMLWLQTNKTGSGTMNLGGSLTRQMEKDETVSDSSPHIANIGRLVEVSAGSSAHVCSHSSEFCCVFLYNLLIPVVAGCVVAQCCPFHPSQLSVGTKPPSAPCLLLSTAVTSWKMGVPFLSSKEQLPTLRFAFAATCGENYFKSGCYTALPLGLKVQCVSSVLNPLELGLVAALSPGSSAQGLELLRRCSTTLLFHCTVLTEGVPDFHCCSQERRKFSTLMLF
uniref:F-actin-capping protein subunit beta n=1 Tax=Serinus canaria TaxID=9135 RepID=A0A8C9L2X7_SERCA